MSKNTAATVSVLIPERGRPASLDRAIKSLLATTNDSNIEILVAIDDDDPEWIGRVPPERAHTQYFRWPRPLTLGEKINALKDHATGDILFFFANDMVADTEGWPGKIRRAAAKLPNGIGVMFARDEMHPNHASYPIVTRAFVDTVGFFAPPPYPFWFVDSHLDALGILMDQHVEIDVVVSAPDGRGKTHAMTDLPFWVDFYKALEPIRMREALQLAAAAYGQGTARFSEVVEEIGNRQQRCARRVAHLSSPEFLAAWGGKSDSPPHPEYAKVKAYAEQMIADLRKAEPRAPKVAVCVPSGRAMEATMATSLAAMTAFSARHGIQLAILNVQSSDIAHGRNSTVEIALKEGCDWLLWIDSDMRFPPNLLIRLLQHAKPIVGATYCRRVAGADGRYPVLGKLVGPKPEVMTDGLHEALLLPGGLLLVHADVYRKLGWPHYAMAYRWPGDDGLEAFKGLMRNYFHGTPPEDVLAELDGTRFGEWLRAGYALGEYGEQVPSFSEDLWFCRRARKAGFKIFVDLKLTGECAHIGEHAVTCLLGDDVVRLGEAAA